MKVGEIQKETNTFLSGVNAPETMNNSWRLFVPIVFPYASTLTWKQMSLFISETKHIEIGSPSLISPERTL